jgi:hypothetical protein
LMGVEALKRLNASAISVNFWPVSSEKS